jgi:hypothetical protein
MKKLVVLTCLIVAAGCASTGTETETRTSVQDTSKGAAPQDQHLPPGWTEADMKAYAEACTPGKMHELLAKDIGTWSGQNTMWMAPSSEPMKTTCTSKFSKMLDGRFVKCEMSGEMPGMGPYNGFAIYGYDNVSKKFVSSWIDNCGTGIAQGTGELSPDGKTMTWNFTFNCPIQKKLVTMREIDKMTSDTTKTIEMYTQDPKTGKEYQCMKLDLTKTGS